LNSSRYGTRAPGAVSVLLALHVELLGGAAGPVDDALGDLDGTVDPEGDGDGV
jgi:hypothetical protein